MQKHITVKISISHMDSGGNMDKNSGRRTFLGICLAGLCALTSVSIAWPLFRYLSPRSNRETAGKVVIPVKDVVEGDAKFFEYAGSSAVLVRTRDGSLVALSAVCTHLGCIVQWQKDKQDFICPCHAGHYSSDGVVTSGPPPKPLTKIAFSVADGNITIG
jgi:cytochrome b6-f complex iron-sulfur subunit